MESDLGESIDLSEEERKMEQQYEAQNQDETIFNIDGFIIKAFD